MTRRGRPAKPTATHRAKGTFREDRHGHRNVEAREGMPEQPPGLSAEAKKAWAQLETATAAVPGLVSTADVISLEGLARAVARWRSVARQVDRLGAKGLVVKGSHGPRAHPLLALERETWSVVQSGLASFGLSPADRAKLRLPDGDGDPFAELVAALAGLGHQPADDPDAKKTAKRKTPAKRKTAAKTAPAKSGAKAKRASS